MIFVTTALLAVILYIRGYKTLAMIVFFFFLTSGFNLVPEEMTELGFISKGTDYAFFILLGVIAIDFLFAKNYFKPDIFTKCLLLFGSFIIICVLYNRFFIKIGWSEIIRTARYVFFWMAYFVFRNMEKEQLEKLLKYLFTVTACLSVLYLLQLFVGKDILVESVRARYEIFGIKTIRFYNQPAMIQFCALMAVFHNPYKGILKIITTTVLTLALLAAFHRSLIGFFALSLAVGYILRLPRLQRIKVMSVFLGVLLLAGLYAGNKFVKSRIFSDLQMVSSGNFADLDISMEDLGEATFAFRMAHLLERNQYLREHPKSMIFGAGLLTEDNKNIDKFFDFKIGLIEELTGNMIQLDTADISYSVLFLRFGYLGTFLNLLLFVYLMIFFYKKRENKYGFFSFLYFILSFGVSLFSANLVTPVNFILPLISYQIVKKTESENTDTINE